jgi:hypothetical protein
LQQKELQKLLLKQAKKFFILINRDNNNNNNNLMLEYINSFTELPLLFAKKTFFNFLLNAIFNSATRTFSNKKVVLNYAL